MSKPIIITISAKAQPERIALQKLLKMKLVSYITEH